MDTTDIKRALQDLHSKTVYNGAPIDIQSKQDFDKIVTLQSKSSDIMFNMSAQLAEGDTKGLRNTLNMQNIEEDMLAAIYTHMMENPVSLAVFIVFSGVVLITIVYCIWSCRRCSMVRNLRHLEPRDNRFSKLNYLWAFAGHRRLDVNINKRELQKVKDVLYSLYNVLHVYT